MRTRPRASCSCCYVDPLSADGRRRHSAYMKRYHAENAERLGAQRAEYRDANRSKIRKAHRDWHAAYPHLKLLNLARARAKKRGIEFSITDDDILPLPPVCPVLGIPLRKGIRSSDPNAWSLDRIDNERGYVPGNVAVISRRANVLKRDASLDELRRLTAWLETQT